MKNNKRSNKTLLIFIFILFLFFQIYPYFNNFRIQGEDKVFSGFIMRWNDNNTYIAKMKQGFEGEWLFTLDYAKEKGEGAFIYPLYLGLGHIVRILNLDYLFTFHFARIIASVLMFFSLFRYVSHSFFEEKSRTKEVVFLAILAGTGFSWVSFYFSDVFTSMLEAFPNNAAFVNVHFPLTLACMFYIFTPYENGSLKWHDYFLYAILSAICGFVSSFAVIVLIVVLGGVFVIRLMLKLPTKESLLQLIAVGNGGGWIILYQFWVLKTNPDFILWSHQNVIGKISVANFLISFFPYFFLALFGFRYFFRNIKSFNTSKLSFYVWGLSIPFLLLIPADISTRFLIAGFVPYVLISFDFILSKSINKETLILKLSSYASFILIILEISLLILIGQQQFEMDFASTFIQKDVYDSYLWIDDNLPQGSYILTEHYNGNYIPRFTSSIPTLGHWCETPYAYDEDLLVKSFFSGNTDLAILKMKNIDYIFYGPSEQVLGNSFATDDLQIIYKNDGVIIYKIMY